MSWMLRGLWAIGLMLWLPGVGLAEPACKQQCDELDARGELSPGVSHAGCFIRLCQREGRHLYEAGKYDQALESLDWVKAQLGDSPSFLMDRGMVLYALGRFDEALQSFERILSGFPKNVRAGAQRAHTLGRLGRLDDALAQFQQLLENPASEGEFKGLDTRSYIEGNIGILQLMKGEVPQGKAALLRAFKLDKRNALAGTYLNNLVPYLEIGAIEPEGVRKLVQAHEALALKQYRPAAHRFEELLQKFPRYAPGYQRLAEILRSYQMYGECEKLLRSGEAALPESINLRAERLRCTLLRVGPGTDAAAPAVKELRELFRKHPENDRVRAVLSAVGYDKP